MALIQELPAKLLFDGSLSVADVRKFVCRCADQNQANVVRGMCDS